MPNIKKTIVPKKVLPKFAHDNLKILFSTSIRINDIQVKYSFFITGDKFGTRKIAEFVVDSFAPAEIFETVYPYNDLTANLSNFGVGKNDFTFSAKSGTTIYPYFQNNRTGGIAPGAPGNVFAFLDNRMDDPILEIYTGSELKNLLSTDLPYIIQSKTSQYGNVIFAGYPSNDPRVQNITYFLINLPTKEVFNYTYNGAAYLLPSEDFLIPNPPSVNNFDFTAMRIFTNDLGNAAIYSLVEVGDNTINYNKVYLVEKIDNIKTTYKLNNAELLNFSPHYTWKKNQIFVDNTFGSTPVINGDNNISILLLTLTKAENEVNVSSRVINIKRKLKNIPVNDPSLNTYGFYYLPPK